MKLLVPIVSCLSTTAVHAAPVEYVQEIRIPASPEKVWDALTKPELVKTWHMAPLQKIELEKDGEIVYARDGNVLISGTITEVEPAAKLAHTFRFGTTGHSGTETDGSTLVTYTLAKDGTETVLKVVHSGFTEKNQTFTNATAGWPFIIKKLKASFEKTASP
ncbi:MAG: hypothetical protein EOP85_22990 [Verrucomicrobiaceae bacterium]|nr:MAG: hypothetical protein EOP85_22990 [Verrucomicrobiaceae bacterium]